MVQQRGAQVKREREKTRRRERRGGRETHTGCSLKEKQKTTEFGEIQCLSEVYSLLYSPQQDKHELSTLVQPLEAYLRLWIYHRLFIWLIVKSFVMISGTQLLYSLHPVHLYFVSSLCGLSSFRSPW